MDTLSFDEQKKYHNSFKSRANKQLGDFDIDIDSCEMDGKLVEARGEKWANKLTRKITISDEDQCLLFSGHNGSGKTTELLRVKQQLENAGYYVVLIDCEDLLDLTNELYVEHILLTIVYELIHKIEGEEGLCQNRLAKLFNWLNDTEATLTELKINTGFINSIYAIKENKNIRQKVAEEINASFSTFRNNIKNEITTLKANLRKQTGFENTKDIVVIYDSLERVRGTSANWDAVRQSVEKLFIQDAQYLRLNLHIIYTVPPFLVFDVRDIDFLPTIRVRDKANAEPIGGVDILKQIVYKRMPQEKLELLLGKDYDNVLENIILFCGGYTRDVLRIMQNCLVQETFPVPKETLAKIKQKITDDLKTVIPQESYSLLQSIKKDKYINISEDHRQIIDKLFNLHVFHRYQNGEIWYDIHPGLREDGFITQKLQDTQ